MVHCFLNKTYVEYLQGSEQKRSAWPVHPQPCEDESMESWTTRQANANCLSPTAFTARYLKTRWKDFDFLQKNSRIFKLLATCIDGSEDRAFKMTMFSLNPLKGRDLLRWTSVASDGRRYCPICLSKDKDPYLRLIWRLTFATICVDHKILLRSTCPVCQAAVQPWRTNPSRELIRCYRCSSLLSDAPAYIVETTEPAYIAFSHLLKILQGSEAPNSIGWKYDVIELFRTLEFVIRFLKMVGRMKPRYNFQFSRHTRKFQAGLNGATRPASQLLGEAWILLQEWPERIQPFVRDNRWIFNLLVAVTPHIVRELASNGADNSTSHEPSRLSPLGQLALNFRRQNRNLRVEYQLRRARILKLLSDNSLTPIEVSRQLDLNKNTVRRLLQKFLNEGFLMKQGHVYHAAREDKQSETRSLTLASSIGP